MLPDKERNQSFSVWSVPHRSTLTKPSYPVLDQSSPRRGKRSMCIAGNVDSMSNLFLAPRSAINGFTRHPPPPRNPTPPPPNKKKTKEEEEFT